MWIADLLSIERERERKRGRERDRGREGETVGVEGELFREPN